LDKRMKIVHPTVRLVNYTPDLEKTIEVGGRTCYASCDKITEDSYKDIIPKWMNMKHSSVLEHAAITMEFVTDRGVMAELTRHRHAAFSVQSTRYCNYAKDKYSNEISVIEPYFFTEERWDPLQTVSDDDYIALKDSYKLWHAACSLAETYYMSLVECGHSAQEARSVLPNSLATTIVMTANPREWMHVLELRTHRDAHPQIRQIACPTLKLFQEKWPVIFEGIGNTEHNSPAEVL
jgi:thymidylate synthase (FAD)